jgi:hypothetical protein
VGPGRLLRRAIQADQLSSSSFTARPARARPPWPWSSPTPPAATFTINAVLAGVKDIREAIARPRSAGLYGQRTILFVDEVHRWNKAQQDALLPWVENGTVILIGATTENPYFRSTAPWSAAAASFSSSPHRGGPLRGRPPAPWPTPSAAMAAQGRDRRRRPGPPGRRGQRRRPRGAQRPGAGRGDHAARRCDGAIHRGHGRGRGEHPAPGRALRQGGRLSLRHHQRLYQVAARLGPRRGALLAGQDGLCRRGPALSSSAACSSLPARTWGWPTPRAARGGGLRRGL